MTHVEFVISLKSESHQAIKGQAGVEEKESAESQGRGPWCRRLAVAAGDILQAGVLEYSGSIQLSTVGHYSASTVDRYNFSTVSHYNYSTVGRYSYSTVVTTTTSIVGHYSAVQWSLKL